MFRSTFFFLGAACFVAAEGAHLVRIKRQNFPEEGGHVIDNIFNIPITAIRQTAAAAQSFSPANSQAIDSVLQIPISTLEAVGNLVKATSGQRGQNAEDQQRIRQEKRDKILAQRERQKLQREQMQQQRLKQQQMKRINKNQGNKDLFGLNALSDLLIGNHGFLGAFGGHGGHMVLGGPGGHGSHGMHGGLGGVPDNSQHTYEVHENVEEDTNYSWQGIAAGIGTLHGTRPVTSSIAIQNKIAPKEQRPNRYYDDSRIQNKVAPARYTKDRLVYEDEPPLQNKIAPKSNRISFQY